MLSIVILCLVYVVACTDYDPDDDIGPTVDTVQKELWTENENGIQDNTITVCLQPDTEDIRTSSAYATQVVNVENWVEEHYESIPNADIDFTGWELCPNWEDYEYRDEGTNYVELRIHESGATQTNGKYAVQFPVSTGERRVVHEFAHVLGFTHEYQRPDAPASAGYWSQVDSGTKQCVDGVLFFTSGPWDGEPACNEDLYQYTVAGVYLTEYDFWSVMNSTYCHCVTGLTDLDRLGLSIAYPASFTHSPAVSNSFQLEDRIVARTNSELTTTWTRDGASEDAFDGEPRWVFHNGGLNYVGYYYSFPVSGMSNYPYVSASWDDFQEREHTIPEFELDINNSLHTAILMASNSAIL